jgi:murein DD-endopeptidase MepM/ murein hydrolase activator NlpD
VGGTAAIAQRFAIDWVRMADDGTRFTGDPLKNASYYAWGSEAIAVADGIVVETKDSIPENVPGATSRAVPITLETVGGNHVILDLGKGRYAFYAHLQPGSLRVKLGERVRRGQVLGLVGNSGNSTEPHLHFHVSDANSPLGSEGLPYGYDGFELLGRCTTLGGPCTRSAASGRHGEIPLQNALVRFAP